MAFKAAVINDVCATGGGTQDFTSAGFGTPDAYMVIVSHATANDTEASGACLSVGFGDKTTEGCNATFCRDQLTSTNTFRGGYNGSVLILKNSTSSNAGAAQFSAAITDGIRLNWTTTPEQAYKITVVLFQGVSAKCLINVTSGVTNAVGFEADLVFLASARSTLAEHKTPIEITTYGALSVGIAVNEATAKNMSHNWGSQNAFATGAPYSVLHNDVCMSNPSNSSDNDTHYTIDTYDSDGFTVNKVNGTDEKPLALLALKLTDGEAISLLTRTSRTTVGEDSYGVGFTPGFLFAVGTAHDTLNEYINNDQQCSAFCIGVYDGTLAASHAITDEDASADSEAHSYFATDIHCRIANGAGASAELYQFDPTFHTGGYTLTYTGTPDGTARHMLVLAIGAPPPAQVNTYDGSLGGGGETRPSYTGWFFY